MAIFNCYVSSPQGNNLTLPNDHVHRENHDAMMHQQIQVFFLWISQEFQTFTQVTKMEIDLASAAGNGNPWKSH